MSEQVMPPQVLDLPDTGTGEVLIVAPKFFGYEEALAAELRRRGRVVTLLDERPSNSSATKAEARVAPSLLAARVRSHYREAAARLVGRRLSLVLVVKAEVVPVWFLEHLRRTQPDATFVFYAYDAFVNCPRGESLLHHFDHALSFDQDDVDRLPGLRYRPMFYTPEFRRGAPLAQRPHDLAFIGTVHTDRYAVCAQLAGAASSTDYFFYSPARWHHEMTRAHDAGVRRIPRRDVSFTPRDRAAVAETFGRARAVIDVQRSRQAGVTPRTFEALAAGAKVITVNDGVRRDPCYDPRWVLVLPEDRSRWDLDEVRAFLADDTMAPEELLAPYSVESWIDDLLDLPARAPRRPQVVRPARGLARRRA